MSELPSSDLSLKQGLSDRLLGLIVLGIIEVVAVNTLGQPELPSNGRQIYFAATSQQGTPISSDLGMGMMSNGMVKCVDGHGPDGRSGHV